MLRHMHIHNPIMIIIGGKIIWAYFTSAVYREARARCSFIKVIRFHRESDCREIRRRN